jgi:hypothetical protein
VRHADAMNALIRRQADNKICSRIALWLKPYVKRNHRNRCVEPRINIGHFSGHEGGEPGNDAERLYSTSWIQSLRRISGRYYRLLFRRLGFAPINIPIAVSKVEACSQKSCFHPSERRMPFIEFCAVYKNSAEFKIECEMDVTIRSAPGSCRICIISPSHIRS